MVYRYVSLLGQETVYYRTVGPDYAHALVLLWVPVAFLRQSVAADPRPVNTLIKLWEPQGKKARGAHSFNVQQPSGLNAFPNALDGGMYKISEAASTAAPGLCCRRSRAGQSGSRIPL